MSFHLTEFEKLYYSISGTFPPISSRIKIFHFFRVMYPKLNSPDSPKSARKKDFPFNFWKKLFCNRIPRIWRVGPRSVHNSKKNKNFIRSLDIRFNKKTTNFCKNQLKIFQIWIHFLPVFTNFINNMVCFVCSFSLLLIYHNIYLLFGLRQSSDIV